MPTITSPVPKPSSFTELEAELETFALTTDPRGCLVTIRNNTTAEREALIVAAGVQFHFYAKMPVTTPPTAAHVENYMAGPVHIEVPAGSVVPFRFSDPRFAVFQVRVGLRVLFGNAFGFPPAQYENYFWELPLPPLPAINPPPLHERIAEIHLDFRTRRNAPIQHPRPPGSSTLHLPSGTVRFPPIPDAGLSKHTNWFEIEERPR